jgi:S-adenosylmethionine synthetase
MDRSAAYATRHIAKNLVAAGVADEILDSFLCYRFSKTNGYIH